MVWVSEESYQVQGESDILLVEDGDCISEKFELTPGLFSKTSGVVTVQQKSNSVQIISIKSGLVYEGRKFKTIRNKLYYPGEVLFSHIQLNSLAFCEQISNKNSEQLLIRSIEIYEFSYINLTSKYSVKLKEVNSPFGIESRFIYAYKPNQIIHGTRNLSLISNVLAFKSKQLLTSIDTIELVPDNKDNSLNFCFSEKVSFNNYLAPDLRYKNIQVSSLIQQNQFIEKYTIISYLEAVTLNSVEIVKIKIKKTKNPQIFLISNDDCFKLNKKDFPNKTINSFILNNKKINSTGKIIIENKNSFTLQRGRPYFFPNCTNELFINKTNLQYKLVAKNRIFDRILSTRNIAINYFNTLKFSSKTSAIFSPIENSNIITKAEFSSLFLKRNGKLYSTLMPQFIKKFSVNQGTKLSKHQQILNPNFENYTNIDSRTLLLQSSELIKNKYRSSDILDYQLTLVKFIEKQPFKKITKSVGLHSITEDYFEQDVNSVFCKNNEFIETDETIGLLNLEKEITGDIVQGLPRIEEILEARKKNSTIKKLPTSQKKGLLVQKTSLDPNFEFRKIGLTVKENDKINPHKLLKVYFNYYGLVKSFSCDRTKTVKYTRLLQNYEGSYKSFKKVQSFILNSVQSVYQSQGVTINDKHLEVIIKQMTTKVLITYEGNTPLLRREIIDLYHIQYINKIVESQSKQPAYYVPLLLGITKAALNNPSFISAASFQETTRVLTTAAIEGRMDWLRGLKENIIIGHLIPAGTGSRNYRNFFKKRVNKELTLNDSLPILS